MHPVANHGSPLLTHFIHVYKEFKSLASKVIQAYCKDARVHEGERTQHQLCHTIAAHQTRQGGVCLVSARTQIRADSRASPAISECSLPHHGDLP